MNIGRLVEMEFWASKKRCRAKTLRGKCLWLLTHTDRFRHTDSCGVPGWWWVWRYGPKTSPPPKIPDDLPEGWIAHGMRDDLGEYETRRRLCPRTQRFHGGITAGFYEGFDYKPGSRYTPTNHALYYESWYLLPPSGRCLWWRVKHVGEGRIDLPPGFRFRLDNERLVVTDGINKEEISWSLRRGIKDVVERVKSKSLHANPREHVALGAD